MKKFYFFPLVFLLLWSCTAPQVVTKIIPEAPEGKFAMGREYIPLSNFQLDVELGFDGIYDDQLVFDFVVINKSSEYISVDADNFYYVLLDSPSADTSLLPPRMAVKPEKVMLNYDEIIEDKKGQKRANSFLGILEAGMGLLATTAAVVSTESPVYIADGLYGLFGTADHYISQDKKIKSDLEEIHEEKELVKEEIFRSGELAPGEVVSGYVYFPQHNEAEYYMFCFPLDAQVFQFVYRQKKEVIYY